MGLKQQINPGVNFTPAYQASGTPWVRTYQGSGTYPAIDSTAVNVKFPYVTRWIMISAKDNAFGQIRIGFSENGVDGAENADYFLLNLTEGTGVDDASFYMGQTPRLELRCKEIWIRAESTGIQFVSIMAGLTGITAGSFPVLTGSEGFRGIG